LDDLSFAGLGPFMGGSPVVFYELTHVIEVLAD
jgi:hypothetical protein